MQIEVNGVTLWYRKAGSGDPLILVHGNGESHEIFNEAVEVLRHHFTVYAVDSRGHGKSTPVKEFHYQDMADDLKEFITKLGLKNVTFYGFSDGGILGLLLASQTDLCRQYIVSGANSRTDGVSPKLVRMLKLMYFVKRDPLLKLMVNEPNIPDSELQKIRTDFVLLAGSGDLITEAHTRHLHETIPGSRMEILDGEDHGSYIVHSTKIADLILKYTGRT